MAESQLALVQWKEYFFAHMTKKQNRLVHAVLKQIENQRNGEEIDATLIRKVIDSMGKWCLFCFSVEEDIIEYVHRVFQSLSVLTTRKPTIAQTLRCTKNNSKPLSSLLQSSTIVPNQKLSWRRTVFLII